MPSRAVGATQRIAPSARRRGRELTIEDVARAAGVSVSTVSRVARGHSDVSEQTRAHVKSIIAELNYRPSGIARALVAGRSQTLGLLVSDIANPFYPELASSIEAEAKLHGYGVIICNTQDSVPETRGYIERMVDQGVDALIHASVGQDEEMVMDLMAGQARVVFVNRRPIVRDADYVVSDNFRGSQELTRHLLQLGHRQIGFVTGPAFASNARERLSGFLETMHGCEEAEPLIIPGDFTHDSGSAAAAEMLAQDPLPSAIVAVNDGVALGVMEALSNAGLRVPEDVAIAGFDDIGLASSSILGLTSVAQHIGEMGRRAVEGILTGKPGSLKCVLEPTLVIRRTTAGTHRASS